MTERTYTADDVRRVRNERECSIDEAKHILDAEQLERLGWTSSMSFAEQPLKHDFTRRILAAKDLHDLKVVLVDIGNSVRHR